MDGLPINVTDLAIIAILVISGLLAFARGFLREVLSVGAWIGAAAATIYGFPLAKPFLRDYISTQLLADVITGVVIFVVSLGILSALSHMVSRSVRGSAFGPVDRSLGLLFGLLRGAVVVCGAWLLLALVMAPADRPDWITEARSLPLVEAGAQALAGLLPNAAVERGAQAIDGAIDGAVDEASRLGQQAIEEKALQELGGTAERAPEAPPATEDSAVNPAAPAEGSAYKDRERQDMDLLFEQTQ